jgi:hypothetical protein
MEDQKLRDWTCLAILAYPFLWIWDKLQNRG